MQPRGFRAAMPRGLSLIIASGLAPLAARATGLAAAAKHLTQVQESQDPGASPSPAAPAISESSSKQVLAVLDTLRDITSSIEGEQAKESKLFEEFDKWCKTEEENLATALDSAQGESESSDVSSRELTATTEQLDQTLKEIEKTIEETNDVMAQATSVRGDESGQFDDDMQLNRESLSQVEKAIAIVGKLHGESGLLQSGVAQRYQINEPGESSYVLGIMKGLKEKLEKTRAALDEEETRKKDMHGKFMSIKKTELSSLQDDKIQKKNMLTQTRIDLVEVKHLLEKAKVKVTDLTRMVKETQDRCTAKRIAWKARSADRAQEVAALKEAIAFVESGMNKGSQLQMPGKNLLSQAAPSFLQVVQRHRHGVSSHNKKGPAEDVGSSKDVVHKLIALLEKQQSEEKEKTDYCKAELEQKKKEKVGVEDKIKELDAQVTYQDGEINSLGSEVQEMERDIETMKKGLEDATVIRGKEKEAFEAATRDRKLAVKVLRQAMQVLKQFYASEDKTALMQLRDPNAPPETFDSGSARKDIRSSTAVEMMAKVAGEIEQEDAEATKEEAEAAAEFEKLQTDSREEFDRLMEEITQRVKRKAKLVVQMNANIESLTQNKADHEAISSQLTSLHNECDELIANFDKRTKARNFELSQLKDVVDILSGSQVAVRTGLIQAPPAGSNSGESQMPEAALLADNTAALLRDMAGGQR